MMKKRRLPTQITILFLLSFILTSFLLAFLITNGLDNVYENNIYERLEAEGKALKQTQDMKTYESDSDIPFIRYQSQNKTYNISDNVYDYIDKDAINLLISKAASQEEITNRYINTINDKVIYYVILNYQGFFGVQGDDIFITLTDNTMKSDMVRATTLQIVLSCIAAFALGYIIVLLWVSRLISDTKKISNSLEIIGENHYESKLETKRKDEIGELVDNIEVMRKKIIQNEKQKQEIIQGVSHDLKTPIAVIQSYAEALQDGMTNQSETVDIILKECKRLNKKVTKLLHITRLGYVNANNLKSSDIRIDEIIKELIKHYKFQTNADIILNLDKITFSGDRESWLIVIQNIMDNVIRYAKNKIVIELKDKELTIYNDGKPIDEDKLSSIFIAYKKTKDGNFGLGLSIVKSTVEIFGYNIIAENLNDGVIFKITKEE